jgi:hypothetical protein
MVIVRCFGMMVQRVRPVHRNVERDVILAADTKEELCGAIGSDRDTSVIFACRTIGAASSMIAEGRYPENGQGVDDDLFRA